MKIESTAEVGSGAGIDAGVGMRHGVIVEHWYHIEVHDENGTLVWSDKFHNLVTDVGKNKYLDATLVTGSTSPVWYVGLVTGPASGVTYAAADTMGSHSGWTESTVYSNSVRPTWTPGSVSAGSVDNTASKAVFTINGTATLAGAFMVDNSTKGGSTGTLLGEGNFSVGDCPVVSGYTVSVSVTASQS